jgi:hypothetical protein
MHVFQFHNCVLVTYSYLMFFFCFVTHRLSIKDEVNANTEVLNILCFQCNTMFDVMRKTLN